MKIILSIILIFSVVVSINAQTYPGTTWDTRTPSQVGFDTTAFNTALSNLPDKCIVVKNGYIVGTKGNITTTGLIWSASKSLVVLMFARELQQGNLNYDDVVPDSNVPTSPSATYRQFMSMTSDYNLDDPSHSPGNHFAYNNGAVHHYGTKIKETFFAGQTHVQALQNSFVTTLQFENTLGYNTSGFMSGWDGGWSMSTQDLARVAYLVLKKGKWNSTQLVPESFINELYKYQMGNATLSNDTVGQFYNESPFSSELLNAYSFGFWLMPNHPIEGSAANKESIAMIGAFGTIFYISRRYDLVVGCVNTGGTTTNPGPLISGNEFNAILSSLTYRKCNFDVAQSCQ